MKIVGDDVDTTQKLPNSRDFGRPKVGRADLFSKEKRVGRG